MPSVDVATPNDRELVVTRWFDAPAQYVFDAHTKCEHVQRWMLGPPGWSMPVCEIDLHVGGRYRHVWRNDADGVEFGATGEYREIAAPMRIVHTETMDGHDGEALCTLDLTERDGRTLLTSSMVFPSKEARDAALQSGMADGMAQSYDRIDDILKSRKAA